MGWSGDIPDGFKACGAGELCIAARLREAVPVFLVGVGIGGAYIDNHFAQRRHYVVLCAGAICVTLIFTGAESRRLLGRRR